MSKTRMFSALAGCLLMLAAACWMVTGALPLAAAPQVANDAPGVTVDTGGAELLHRPPVQYPEQARKNGISGTVAVQLTLDSAGNVTDAHAISGPQELRKATIQSVLDWHFAHNSAGSTRQVAITFEASEAAPAAAAKTAPAAGAAIRGEATLEHLGIIGLNDSARADLVAHLPVHEGDVLTNDSLASLQAAAKQFDEHLIVSTYTNGSKVNVTIQAPGMRIKVGGNVQQLMLVNQPHPTYPPDAKAARVQGLVQLQAVIGTDGTVKNLTVLKGDPLLAQAALDAVKQWVYKPTLLNGAPVEVQTTIDVNFTLSQ